MPKAPEEIIKLVEKFERNYQAYKNPSFKEENIKQEFINPFFKALGWDVDNTADAAPQYRDVIFEDSIKIAEGTKAPDYCFTLAGRKMFFLEAKKPSVNIDKDIKPSYQLRRYAWSAKLPLSILTDFEEFAVYESRTRPKKTDRASVGRIKYLTYKDYVKEWDYLYNTFSKDAVFKGLFDQYAESTKKKRGTTEVDDEFLSEIETWRELLARDIALRNPDLSVDELNYSVQQIIDRIIFLRMGEDRGAEKYGQLRKLLDQKEIYHALCELWKDADEKYNSGLFHFKEEKGQKSPPDTLTLELEIKDGVFKQIIKNLYYPDSPYEFSVLSPEILGNVYEQFLGKVIRLTKGHRAKVEEKPEVKKAGGVYYTPQYIVDYIVENTVGKLCNGKTPKKVSKLKILDPACGSGSFLLGAYRYLLSWHLDYYTNLNDKKRLKDQIYKGKNNEWHLTIKEKKRILLNNIYGVDIDHQAVNVTKLSLLLKVLEGENKDVLEAQQKLYKERALPDLENNIKCGNSLIGNEIYEDSDLTLDGNDIKRINPFDWKKQFGITKFDAVIGNPPYIRTQAMSEWAPIEVEFYKKKYFSASEGNYDIYAVFVEKGMKLLNEKGMLGYIIPHKFFTTEYGRPLRSLIANANNLDKILHFGHQQVFKKVTTYTCLLFLKKLNSGHNFNFIRVNNLNKWINHGKCVEGKINLKDVTSNPWNFLIEKERKLFDKLNNFSIKLGDKSKIFQGLATSADKVYTMELISKNKETSILISKELNNEKVEIENEILHPLLKGSEISRYCYPDYKYGVLFPYSLKSGTATPITERTMRLKYPKAYDYLKRNKQRLLKRSKTDSSNWWIYPYPKNLSLYERPKLIIQVLSSRGNFFLDLEGEFYFVGGGTAGGNAILLDDDDPSKLKYLLGILNSKVTTYYVSKVASGFKGGFFAFAKSSLKLFPLPDLDISHSSKDQKSYTTLTRLVDQMLQLHEKLANTKIPNEKEMIQRQIDAMDKQIDQLVYRLYYLTPEEIRIIEDSL